MNCLSCSGTVPTNANFFLGSIRSPKVTWSGDGRANLQANRASAVPETRGGGVLGAARSAMRRGVTAARDHSRRTPAPAQPPLQSASLSRDRRGPATTSERVDSGREDHRAARPHLPLGPDLVPVPRWGRGGTPARGLPDWDGGGRGQEKLLSITGHAPRPPTPITAVVRPKWAGPCAPRPWEAALR